MKLRPLLLSLAVLVPVAGAVWWLQRPAPAADSADARLGQRVIDPALVADAARVRIVSGGQTLELVRNDKDRWTLAGEPVLPADSAKLSRLVADLVEPKVERFVTTNPERLATLDLDAASIVFLDGSGKTLLELDLGKNADTGGGRFIRYGDEAKAYLARLKATIDAEPASWRDTTLVAGVKAEDIASVSINFPDTPAPVVFTRSAKDAAWTSPAAPENRPVKPSALSGPLSNLSSLRFTEATPLADEKVAAARDHSREITLTTFSGRTVKIAFLRAPEPPPAPKPEVKEGETPPPEPPAAPRPVYVEVTDSQPDAVLAEAAKTHVFEIADWIYTSLPAKADDIFEPAPPTPAAPQTPAPTAPSVVAPPAGSDTPSAPPPTISVTTEPISITTEPPPPPADATP